MLATPPAGWLYAAHRRGRDNKRWAGQPIIDALGCSDKQATIVIGCTLTYDYCPTGRAWDARLEAGSPTWVPVPFLTDRAAS